MSEIQKQPASVIFNGKAYPFPDGGFAEVSRTFVAVRDETGATGSDPRFGPVMPKCEIVAADGAVVARVSYNGRVWPAVEWRPGLSPLYDPRARGREGVTQ